MQTGSYLELALTIYAWQVSNRLAEMIIASGLIYLPLLFIVWRNWSQTARSQEAKSAAPVSLRRMEQDVIVLFFTIIFAFLPAVSVTAGEIYYESPLTSEEITGSNPDIPYATAEDGSPDSIKIPILWWVVHQASAGFVQLFIAGVNSFGEPTHRRAISLVLDYAQLNDPQLQAELQFFDRDCYLQSLAKLESGPSLQGRRPPEWRGDDFWFDTPGFYDHYTATTKIGSWAAKYDWVSITGKPGCNEWWRGADLGLESRLYSYIERTTSIGSSKTDMDGVGNPLQIDPKEKSRAVRAFLKKSPPDILGTMTGGDSAPGNKGNPIAPSSWLGKAGILIGYALAKTATFIITIGLPMVQAIVLACVYIALPIAVPFATLRPGLLVFFISALFSLKFLTALWALSKFIDERMIDYMYGDTGILVQWGFNDMVLTIITSLSYVGLPIVWLWLMSSFTGKGVEGVNLLFAYSAAKLDSAAQQSAGIVQSTVMKGKGKEKEDA